MDTSSTRGTFDGATLLREQADMLAQAPPADINFLQFLKLKRNAQQRATAQRNQQQRSGVPQRAVDAYPDETGRPGSANGLSAATPSPNRSRAASRGAEAGAGVRTAETAPAGPRLGRDDAVNNSRTFALSAPGSSGAIPLDEMPASVAKRRSMGEQPPPGSTGGLGLVSFDDIPAVAASRSATSTSSVPPEQLGEAMPLEECPHCGRTFAVGRLARHEDTCRRQQEREQDLQRRRPTNRTAAAPRGSVTDSTGGAFDSRRPSNAVQPAAPQEAKSRPLATAKVPSTHPTGDLVDESDEN